MRSAAVRISAAACLWVAGIVTGTGNDLLTGQGFRVLEPPVRLRFSEPTPAYNPDKPDEKLGEFQPGIEVGVISTLPETDHWKVRFQLPGQPPVDAIIPAPRVKVSSNSDAARALRLLDEFPLLYKLLSSEQQPWNGTVQDMARRFIPEEVVLQAGTFSEPERLAQLAPKQPVWGVIPLEIAVDGSPPMPPRIVIDLWNKGEAYRSTTSQSRVYQTIRANLAELERIFGQRPVGADRRVQVSPTIGAIRDSAELYYLPNDTIALLRNLSQEYLVLELHSYENGALSLPPYDPATFASSIRERVRISSHGHVYLSDIPMIYQGNKGYCASASLARILNYYGQPVDMHALSRLANTEAQMSEMSSGGTRYQDLIASMRRVCATTPFQLRQLRQPRKDVVLETIRKGVPIFWLIPGHARLIIGMHPETSEIVYSDSWGPAHAFKTMSWEEFLSINQEMWILEPKS